MKVEHDKVITLKEEFKVEQRNLERAKTLQDSFAGETKADRIDAYRQA